MQQSHCQELYPLMDRYIQIYLLEQNSLFSNHQGILTAESLNKCKKYYIENYDDSKKKFGEKIVEQFKEADINTRLVFAHIEWLWCFATRDITIGTKHEIIRRTTQLNEPELNLNGVYPDGFGNAGMYHKNNKYFEIVFLLRLVELLFQKVEREEITSPNEVKNWIEAICLRKKYEDALDDYPLSDDFIDNLPYKEITMCNILTYLCFPDKYERIASNNHKSKILNSYSGLLAEDERLDKNVDEQIFLIRSKLTDITDNSNLDFYEDRYVKVWNYALTQEGFDEVQGLLYKKAIILYGPPGTSKTYTADRLAHALITKRFLEKRENVIKYFKSDIDFTSHRIHRLQLHTNYTYEDFVAGVQLKGNETIPVKGKLFQICEEAAKDSLPHILILDEINRVDLSRLFGEVFSALENRNQAIEVGIGNFKLSIPENLYVIGTMNEIDFSLERIDFALRRRFLWFFYGFNEEVLKSIIEQKNTELNTKLKTKETERFTNAAKALNDTINKIPELGEQYQIGHTFFAEIVDIFASYKNLNGYSNRLKNKLYRKDGGAVKILWNISIAPMLEAFLGNLDKSTKKRFMDKLSKTYFQ